MGEGILLIFIFCDGEEWVDDEIFMGYEVRVFVFRRENDKVRGQGQIYEWLKLII